MWLSLSLRRRRDPSFVIAVSLAIVSPEFNPTSVIQCLSLKTVESGTIYYLPVNFETAASDTIYSILAFQLKSNTNNSNKAA